jgi:hypothetical protein
MHTAEFINLFCKILVQVYILQLTELPSEFTYCQQWDMMQFRDLLLPR